MKSSKTRLELSQRISEIIQKFEEDSRGEIKQKDLAQAIKVSESTLTKAKNPFYQMPINTLESIKDNLESLCKKYEGFSGNSLIVLKEKSAWERIVHKLKKRKFILFVLSIIVIIILVVNYYEDSNTNDLITTDDYKFIDQSLTKEYLDSTIGIDWFIRDKDSLLLEKYKDSIYLTIGTEVGDYFSLHGEEYRIEKIPNLFYRKIDCGSCCIIKLKISNFHPSKPHQQAGFLLFYTDTIAPRYYTRLTYGYKGDRFSGTDSTVVLPIFYKYNSKDYMLNGPKHLAPLSLPHILDPDKNTNNIWLKVKIKEGIYTFSYRNYLAPWLRHGYFLFATDYSDPPAVGQVSTDYDYRN
jgi:hypothetical protein